MQSELSSKMSFLVGRIGKGSFVSLYVFEQYPTHYFFKIKYTRVTLDSDSYLVHNIIYSTFIKLQHFSYKKFQEMALQDQPQL